LAASSLVSSQFYFPVILFPNITGNRVREPVSPSRREAEIVLSKWLTEVRENKHPILKKKEIKKIKFVDFAEKYIKEHAKPLKKS
jgi:hypothetical protein